MRAAFAFLPRPGVVASGLLLAMALTGCVHSSGTGQAGSGSSERSRLGSTGSLREDLVALAPVVREDEARDAASIAVEGARELAQQYHVVRPALLHNFLVNLGLKKRGLCYHWAEDLLERLQRRQLTTLELHWGIARAGTMREHNCVIVTATNQPFERGIVLDAWRHSGRLYWGPVRTDRYPWKEAELNAPAEGADAKTADVTNRAR